MSVASQNKARPPEETEIEINIGDNFKPKSFIPFYTGLTLRIVQIDDTHLPPERRRFHVKFSNGKTDKFFLDSLLASFEKI
jgi:hypothetical protein